MARDQRDYYYHQAQKDGYRSRASYKLKQINERMNVIKRGDTIVDLGAAPGGWLQVARELSGGRILGVDLQPIREIEGVTTIKGDITAQETIDRILEFSKGGVDVVLCDAAPNLSGNWVLDHARGIELNDAAFECAKKILKPKGTFVVKVFQGDLFKDFYDRVSAEFVFVKSYSPQASRSTSAEIYVIAKRFITAPIRKNHLCAVEITGMGESGDGVAYLDDFVIFVSGSQVGDKVKIKIEDVKPNFAFATIIEKLDELPEDPYLTPKYVPNMTHSFAKPDPNAPQRQKILRVRDRSLDIDNYVPPEDEEDNEFS
ncbi:Ribosomal RNA large subunit methyltransferase E [Methanosarcinaceae archaeon Ag5]|uniref:Ribosomal RNA large subunit methyltransferase E n=1 Tax=Methanolapillus africanus TaxID=3028297 RepID=A0AAE4MIA6_9EURY|nr:Ribosomal RNA large subunit methyltransferase E [Methanosarcinaceae archaeon Ag5]